MSDLGQEREAEPPPEPEIIESTFRNGSLTAISVGAGFSLSFLNRWAALPGSWQVSDLIAVGAITIGIAFQIATLASMLSTRSLILKHYNRSVTTFLIGLTLVAIGVCVAIAGDILGHGQRVLGP